MSFRNKGFYWIKYGCKWQIAEWNGFYWFRCGAEWGLIDSNLTKIGDRVIRPDACEAVLDSPKHHYCICLNGVYTENDCLCISCRKQAPPF